MAEAHMISAEITKSKSEEKTDVHKNNNKNVSISRLAFWGYLTTTQAYRKEYLHSADH